MVFFWFPEGGSQGLENIFFFKLLLPFLFHVYWWMPSFDLHFSFFKHQIFFGTPTDCFAFTPFPSPLVQTFFSSVLFPIQCIILNSKLFYECVIVGNSEPMNLPQSFGRLLLSSVSCTFSCNADRESVDAVPDRIRGTPQLTILWDPKEKYFAYLQQKINALMNWGSLKLVNDI